MVDPRQRFETAENALFECYGLNPRTWWFEHKSGVRLRIQEIGHGPPLLFLHGLGMFGASWAPLITYLADHRCVLVDNPGHGLSEGITYKNLHPREHSVAWLNDLVLAVGEGEAMPIVGHSLGSMFSLWLAQEQAARVQSMVLYGVPAQALRGPRFDIGLALLSIRKLNKILLSIPTRPELLKLQMRPVMGADGENLPDAFWNCMWANSQRSAFRQTLASFQPATMRWRTPRKGISLSDQELASIRQPTLLVWGGRDVMGSPKYGLHAVQQMHRAKLHAVDAGHFPQLRSPHEHARELEEFLKSSQPQHLKQGTITNPARGELNERLP